MAADDKRSFWKTAPGVITAVASLITAVAGLLGVLCQTGVICEQSPDGSDTTTTQANTATTGAVTTSEAETTTTEATTTTSDAPTNTQDQEISMATLTSDREPGGMSLLDVDRGLTYQQGVSTSLAHYDEIDVALVQTIELLFYGSVPNEEGLGESRFAVSTRLEIPDREFCAGLVDSEDLAGQFLYASINQGEWVCLLTTEDQLAAFRVSSEYDGTELGLEYVVFG